MENDFFYNIKNESRNRYDRTTIPYRESYSKLYDYDKSARRFVNET